MHEEKKLTLKFPIYFRGDLPYESSLMAEANVIRAAGLVSIDKDCAVVQVESNSKCLVDMFNGNMQHDVVIEGILFNIQCLKQQLRSEGGFHCWDDLEPQWLFNPLTSNHEAFWELISFGFHRNSEVKRVHVSNPMMGDSLGSSCVSSQKQNREGVVGAQSGQYRATVKSSPGCGAGPSRDVTSCHVDITCITTKR
ncbi:hypothetical protein DVH24_018833 [Malus domestica]|uniref:Uncharacterized protein n=1 Tax=Malus domestica TaxID=3750 RepID=A0A498HJ08_MALDO|nr:hypothetical protein DVH24_018833 [Malus domestica]